MEVSSMFNQRERIALLLLGGTLLVGSGLVVLDNYRSGSLEEFHVVRRAVEPPPPVEETGPAGPVDLNEATAAQLRRLPSIGPKTAERILEHRRRNGPFRSVDELREVPGIGPRTLEKLRPLVVVE